MAENTNPNNTAHIVDALSTVALDASITASPKKSLLAGQQMNQYGTSKLFRIIQQYIYTC